MYCDTCKYLKNKNRCEELMAQIYPNYYCHDDSGFYVLSFNIENPKTFGCALHKEIVSNSYEIIQRNKKEIKC